MSINKSIKQLINYAEEKGLIKEADKTYTTNLIIDALGLDSFEEPTEALPSLGLEEILKNITDFAVENGKCEDSITYRDLFDTKIMGLLMPRPSEVREKFNSLYEKSPEQATDYYYNLSCDSNYIRTDRIKKDKKWIYSSEYGDMDITINLSKPEKDPKDIIALKNAPQVGYPKCLLCCENEGYAGRVNSPARQNHRIIPISLDNSDWFWQYSPYVYYNEHCIVFHSEHIPMSVNSRTFKFILDFVAQFPHYFMGSNAGLPVVGGSILSHNHFQGGRYEFAMTKAPIEKELTFKGFEDVEAGTVKWPMATIRLRHESKERLVELADVILTSWQNYTDEDVFIFAETDGEKHNAITPIARMKNGKFELDLVFRNNITTKEHPFGVFHPHEELHNIKKENIGLIEVMGLAVLPARLDKELSLLKEAILEKRDISNDEVLSKHNAWLSSFIDNYTFTEENTASILQQEVGKVFAKVLEHAGVFKRDEKGTKAFEKFINQII